MKFKAFLRIVGFTFVVVTATLSLAVLKGCAQQNSIVSHEFKEGFERSYERFLNDNGLSISDYPDELLSLLERNPETEEFVLNFPLLKDAPPKTDLSIYKDCTSVPHLMQWDTPWGYEKYGSNVMGLTGCGPTCLSMVLIYLLNDPSITPKAVADFSEQNGFCVEGSGSSWELMSVGAQMLGIRSEELPLHEGTIKKHVEKDHPVVCFMGPGDFTTSGHFIVITDYADGRFTVLDPNSRKNSENQWDYQTLAPQIKNLWAMSKPS